MKKKILSLIAVTAALSTASCALVACSGDDVKTEVTQEQWKAALSLSSFESNFKASIFTVNEDEKATQEYIFAVGSEKYGDYSLTRILSSLEGVKESERSEIRIVGAEQDAYYSRRSEIEEEEGKDGEWKEGEWRVENKDHETYDDEEWTEMLGNIGLSYTFLFADKYNDFEYKNGTYVFKGKEGVVIDEDSDSYGDYSYSYTVTTKDIKVKFSNNKLASVEMIMNNKYESTYNGETEVSDTDFQVTVKLTYGGQKITPPASAKPSGSEEE